MEAATMLIAFSCLQVSEVSPRLSAGAANRLTLSESDIGHQLSARLISICGVYLRKRLLLIPINAYEGV